MGSVFFILINFVLALSDKLFALMKCFGVVLFGEPAWALVFVPWLITNIFGIVVLVMTGYASAKGG